MIMDKKVVTVVIRRPSGAVRDVLTNNNNGGILGLKVAVLSVLEKFPSSAIVGWRGRDGQIRQIPVGVMP